MGYSKFIQEFVDGTLEKSREDELFLMLSSNDELRNDLRQTIAIDKSFYRKLSSFKPSAAATIGLYSKLGFTTPDNIVDGQPSPAGKAGFFRKNRQGMTWGIISSCLTALLFLLFLIPEGQSPAGAQSAGTKSIAISRDLAISSNSPAQMPLASNIDVTYGEPGLKSAGFKNITIKSRTSGNLMNHNVPVRNYLPRQNTVALSTESQAPANSTDSKKLSITASNFFSEINNEPDFIQHSDNLNLGSQVTLQPITFQQPSAPASESKLGISLELKGSHFWNRPEAQKILTTTSELHNIGLCLSYDVNDWLTVIGEIQNEKFFQKFDVKDPYGNTYEYLQYPNYTNIQAGVRMKFIRKEFFDTFVQLMGGGVQTGGTGSMMLGVEFKPHSDYSFIFSFEGSAIGYYTGNKFYITPKFGVNYGIAVNF